MKILLIFISMLVVTAHIIFPQIIDSTEIQTEETLDELLEESFEEDDNSDLYNLIEELILNPIDINTADIFELQKIPEINPSIAELILSYRNRFGPFYSVNELFAIKELDKELINRIIPFLKVEKYTAIKDSSFAEDIMPDETNISRNIKINLRSRFGNDLQNRTGFENGSYLGSKLKSYNRLLINYSNQIQAGAVLDKDAGEKDFNDFNSYHLIIKNFGLIKTFIAGDYVLEFGQGLMLWSPYSFSKGADAIFPVKKQGKILKPYTSSTEYDFMRGAASIINFSDFSLTTFYSSKKIDANIDSVSNKIISIQKTGLHLTENDLNKKNRVTENIFGGRISYRFQNFLSTALSGYYSGFSNEFEGTKVNEIKGKTFNYYSFDYDLNIQQLNFFGEFVYNQKSVASINGFIYSPLKNFILITSIRNYPSNYTNLHGFAFGEQSGKTNNEFGIYYGIKWRSDFGILNLFYDQFRFPYATFENPVPSSGDEIYISFSKRIFNKANLLLRFKSERKDVSDSFDELKSVFKRNRNSYRAELIYNISNKLRLKSRAEYNTYQINEIKINEKGFLIFQDLRFAVSKLLLLYGRIIFFETDSFNSAVYEFENDLTGVLTNLAMYDKGIRWYLMIRYKPLKFISLSMKYSETYKPDAKTLSSGNNLINNNIDNRISFQIDVNY